MALKTSNWECIVQAISTHLHKTIPLPMHLMRDMLAAIYTDLTCKLEQAAMQHENTQHQPNQDDLRELTSTESRSFTLRAHNSDPMDANVWKIECLILFFNTGIAW